MKEYKDRREVENIYEYAKQKIKEQLEQKCVSMKGSAKGMALSEIMSVLDKELEIDIAEELINARQLIRNYYNKYSQLDYMDRQYKENQKKLEEQQKMIDETNLITDETLKNIIYAYNVLSKNHSKDNAKEIIVAYLNSKNREDLTNMIEGENDENGKSDG